MEEEDQSTKENKKLSAFINGEYLNFEFFSLSLGIFSYNLKLNPESDEEEELVRFFQLLRHISHELNMEKALKIDNTNISIYKEFSFTVESLAKKYLENTFVNEPAKEQENFVPVTSYYVNLVVKDADGVDTTIALVDSEGEKIDFTSKEEALSFINKLPKEVSFKELKKEEKVVASKPPFTLSELYQVGNSLYHYSTKNILAAAKALFENGYITYPRTDSHRLAPEFINKTKDYIKETYGEAYVGTAKGQNNNKGQDAHEALRPTDLSITAASLKEKIGTAINKRVYDLIYKRTVQSIMQPKIEEENTYVFECGGYKFETKKPIVLFKGFTILDKTKEDNYQYKFDEDASYPYDDKITNVTTKAPADYTEGSLVKKMEETGIGRPSTYATMVNTLLTRGYIINDKSYLKITPTGRMVVEYLIRHFADTVVNIEYTSDMEAKLDAIENEEADKIETIRESNTIFLDEFNATVSKPDHQELKTGEKCPVCGGDLVIKHSKNGEFIGCSNYPNCTYFKPEEVGRNCPDCGAPLIYRTGPTGKFIGCSNYPKCNHTELIKKTFRRKRSSK